MAMRIILPAWFDHLKERFSYKESKFNEFNLPVITNCPHAENVNETPGYNLLHWHSSGI